MHTKILCTYYNVTLYVLLISTKPETNEANILVKIEFPSLHTAQLIIHDMSQIANDK